PQPFHGPVPAAIKALYGNAWAFGSSKLWQLVRLAAETEINAFVVDVKDDTGCMLYPSAVPTAQEIGANACVRTKDARARLDTLVAHGIYPIARFVVAKDPLLAEHKPGWSVQHRDGGLWRDRIGMAWVDAYNDSVWIYAAQLAREAVKLGFQEVQFDYVRFPDEPRERLETAVFPARRPGQSQRAARGVGPPAPTRQVGRSPSLPAGLHIGTAAAALHPLRDPRADPRGGRAGHHLLGAVEPP